MAYVSYIQKVGDSLHLVNDNGSKIVAYPTNGDLWTLPEPVNPDPDPDPPPSGGTRFQWPCPLSSVSSEYGPRQGGYSSVHQGIDLAPGAGTVISAAGDGVVHQNSWHSNFGNLIIVKHPAVGNSGPLFTVYAHRESHAGPGVGGRVNKGMNIGRVGNTGASFGAHLHFETHVGGLNWNNPGTHINPRIFIPRFN